MQHKENNIEEKTSVGMYTVSHQNDTPKHFWWQTRTEFNVIEHA